MLQTMIGITYHAGKPALLQILKLILNSDIYTDNSPILIFDNRSKAFQEGTIIWTQPTDSLFSYSHSVHTIFLSSFTQK